MIKKFLSNPFAIFYLVFVYTIAFSLWWAYLLYAKNEAAFREKLELDKIHFKTISGSEKPFESTATYQLSFEKYRRQKLMILTEGSVFVLLLFIGLMQVRRVFSKEIALASLQRNFLLSITHELKSPLASIKASLQTFQRKNLVEEKKEKLINNSLSDIERLENLVDNILFAAKIEREEHGLTKENLDVSIVCENVLKRFANNKKNIHVSASIEPNVFMQTDKVGFTSVITNLVENAIKYSPQNAEVHIELLQQNGITKLTVADTGNGIPAEEKEKIFQKFYRIGSEETRKTKGTGLGLYIVKRFVDVFDGKISVKDNQPHGAIFELEF
jgi:signal transduction histidine kinase